jgi:hypothetical protein
MLALLTAAVAMSIALTAPWTFNQRNRRPW